MATLSESHWVTVGEVARRWKVSKMTIYRLCEAGTIHSIRVGRQVRVSRDSVLEYERKQNHAEDR